MVPSWWGMQAEGRKVARNNWFFWAFQHCKTEGYLFFSIPIHFKAGLRLSVKIVDWQLLVTISYYSFPYTSCKWDKNFGVFQEHQLLFIFYFQPQGTSVWLGGTDLASEGDWVWQGSGNDIVYDRFQPSEPNGGTAENCLIMMYENGNWIDGSCSSPQNFHICEIPTTKPTTPAPKAGNIACFLNAWGSFSLHKRGKIFLWTQNFLKIQVEILNVVTFNLFTTNWIIFSGLFFKHLSKVRWKFLLCIHHQRFIDMV